MGLPSGLLEFYHVEIADYLGDELSIEQLEGLVEALLDFSVVADLEAWLNHQAG